MSEEGHFESTQSEELVSDSQQQCSVLNACWENVNKYLSHLLDQEIEVFRQFWCKA
jgi:hypothetical protein